MASNVQHLMLLCRCLKRGMDRAEKSQLRDELTSADDGLTGLISLASEQYLTPALYCALIEIDLLVCLPGELQTYLAGVYKLNLERNEDLKKQALETAATLNGIDIEPVLLKGGVHLFHPAFDDLGSRMMVDIDMMVPKAKLEHCIEVLKTDGYVPEGIEWTYHFPAMERPGDRATLELHAEAAEQRSVLPADEALSDAVPIDAGSGVRLKSLSPTHQVWHNIFHAQVQDRNYVLGTLPVRQIYDFAALNERLNGSIDWQALSERMRAHGLHKVLAAHLYQADKLFGVSIDPVVLGSPGPALGTRLHFRRCLTQFRWRPLGSIARSLGALTHPFKKYNIELIYGQSNGLFSLLIKRLRHAAHLLAKYKFALFARIASNKDMHYLSL